MSRNRVPPAQLIASRLHLAMGYRPPHPLGIPRHLAWHGLVEALGWLDPAATHEAQMADRAALECFHTPDYLDALWQAEQEQSLPVELRQRYGIGARGNPIFDAVYRRPVTAVGGSLLAASMVLEGVRRVHVPIGGNHHGRPDRASGFCYVNDIVLAMLRLREGGLRRQIYLDIDAHHGDGVLDAFRGDPEMLLISLHEAGRWPHTGEEADQPPGTVNLPLPAGLHDGELDLLRCGCLMDLIGDFPADCLVLVCGADGLHEDRQSRWSLSNGAIWRLVADVLALDLPVIIWGGGGYNPWALARCWSGIWGLMCGQDVWNTDLEPRARHWLEGLRWPQAGRFQPPACWFESLLDPPRTGPVRAEVRDWIPRVQARRSER